MRTEAGKMPESLVFPIRNGLGVSNDRFGFKFHTFTQHRPDNLVYKRPDTPPAPSLQFAYNALLVKQQAFPVQFAFMLLVPSV